MDTISADKALLNLISIADVSEKHGFTEALAALVNTDNQLGSFLEMDLSNTQDPMKLGKEVSDKIWNYISGYEKITFSSNSVQGSTEGLLDAIFFFYMFGLLSIAVLGALQAWQTRISRVHWELKGNLSKLSTVDATHFLTVKCYLNPREDFNKRFVALEQLGKFVIDAIASEKLVDRPALEQHIAAVGAGIREDGGLYTKYTDPDESDYNPDDDENNDDGDHTMQELGYTLSSFTEDFKRVLGGVQSAMAHSEHLKQLYQKYKVHEQNLKETPPTGDKEAYKKAKEEMSRTKTVMQNALLYYFKRMKWTAVAFNAAAERAIRR